MFSCSYFMGALVHLSKEYVSVWLSNSRLKAGRSPIAETFTFFAYISEIWFWFSFLYWENTNAAATVLENHLAL